MTRWSLYQKIKQTPLNGLVHQTLTICDDCHFELCNTELQTGVLTCKFPPY
jgi:hypothetical protein